MGLQGQRPSLAPPCLFHGEMGGQERIGTFSDVLHGSPEGQAEEMDGSPQLSAWDHLTTPASLPPHLSTSATPTSVSQPPTPGFPPEPYAEAPSTRDLLAPSQSLLPSLHWALDDETFHPPSSQVDFLLLLSP